MGVIQDGWKMTDILIAEDDAFVSSMYADLIRECFPSATLKLVGTGDEAISAIEQMLGAGKKPGIVITDNEMPGKMTGMDVIDYVKANFPDTHIVMIAGENFERTVGKTAVQKGASAYLPKPFEMSALLEIVEKYVK